jgi:MFS family permease
MRFLLRHRAFARLWFASTISQLGTQVTVLVVPLIALKLLGASTFAVSALGVAEFLPFILVGLQAGAILDRRERKPIMLWCDVVRAVVLMAVPITWALGMLHLWLLYVVVFVVGLATVFFDVSAQSITPDMVALEDLGDANQTVAAAESVARTAGPGMAGLLLAVVSAPVAIMVDVVSYVASFWLLLGVQPAPVERETDEGEAPPLRQQIGEGFSFVRHHPTLRPLLLSGAFGNLAAHIQHAVLITFMVRTLHYSSALIGLLFMVGNLGVVVGAAQSMRVTRLLGLGRMLWLMSLIIGILSVLVALASGRFSLAAMAIPWFLIAACSTIYNVGGLSYRQAATPAHLQGRMNATFRFFVWGAIPIGFLLGGVFGTVIGLRNTVFLSGVLTMIPFIFILYSPMADVASLTDALPLVTHEDVLVGD